VNKTEVRCRILLGLAAGVIAWAAAGASPAAAEPEPNTCEEIAKGDVPGCKAEAARTCADAGDAWARRQCERKIAIKYDQCLSSTFEKAAGRKQALFEKAGGNDAMASGSKAYFDDDDQAEQRWLARVQTVEAESAEYAALHKQWAACSQTFRADDAEMMEGLPGRYKAAYKETADKVLAKMKEMEPDPNAKKGMPGSALDDGVKKTAERLVAMATKMPASFRYKDKELKAGLAQSDANAAAMETWKANERAAQIANTRCTPGKPLGGSFVTLAKKLILSNQYANERQVVKQVYRQTSALERGRHGLISNETITASVCRMTSANTCSEIHVLLIREKPPGNPWTSWEARFSSSDEPFNCKKF